MAGRGEDVVVVVVCVVVVVASCAGERENRAGEGEFVCGVGAAMTSAAMLCGGNRAETDNQLCKMGDSKQSCFLRMHRSPAADHREALSLHHGGTNIVLDVVWLPRFLSRPSPAYSLRTRRYDDAGRNPDLCLWDMISLTPPIDATGKVSALG